MIGGGCQHRWRAGHSSSECTLKTCLLCVSWKSKLYWTEKQRFGVSLVRASSVRPSVQGCVSAGGGLPGSSLPHLLAPSLAQKVPRVCASRHEATLGPDWSVSAAGRPVCIPDVDWRCVGGERGRLCWVRWHLGRAEGQDVSPAWKRVQRPSGRS